jgi:hypothetical protein
MSELRFDPLRGEWVARASDRNDVGTYVNDTKPERTAAELRQADRAATLGRTR